MRIAVEIAGHMRGFESTVPSLRVLDGHDVDFYVHTYDERGYSWNGLDGERHLREGFRAGAREISGDQVRGVLADAVVVVERYDEVAADINVLASRLPPKNHYDNPRNVVAMWRKKYLCSRLRQDAGRGPYDIVISTRPDLLWSRPLPLRQAHRRVLVPKEYGYGIASDVAALGPPELMARYCALFDELEATYLAAGRDCNPHQMLATHIARSRLSVREQSLGVRIRRENGDLAPTGIPTRRAAIQSSVAASTLFALERWRPGRTVLRQYRASRWRRSPGRSPQQ